LRNRVYRKTGLRIEVPAADLPSARPSTEHGFIHGSPARVTEAIFEIAALGVGGVIATFRLGPLPHEAAKSSLTLFMREVAPEFHRQ
jgi:alkanesulfonate monooxygenase SsuD/methylene tetrahydromethanopterin reductase-like flavin-dependent oxidoreductase (luciferase family)